MLLPNCFLYWNIPPCPRLTFAWAPSCFLEALLTCVQAMFHTHLPASGLRDSKLIKFQKGENVCRDSAGTEAWDGNQTEEERSKTGGRSAGLVLKSSLLQSPERGWGAGGEWKRQILCPAPLAHLLPLDRFHTHTETHTHCSGSPWRQPGNCVL